MLCWLCLCSFDVSAGETGNLNALQLPADNTYAYTPTDVANHSETAIPLTSPESRDIEMFDETPTQQPQCKTENFSLPLVNMLPHCYRESPVSTLPLIVVEIMAPPPEQ